LDCKREAEGFSMFEPRGEAGEGREPLGDGPEDSCAREGDRVQEKKDRVEPVFACRAVFLVDEFVFGHHETGKDREASVGPSSRFRIGDQQGIAHAEEDGECIDWVADPLPAGEASAAVEPGFVDADRKGLQGEGEES